MEGRAVSNEPSESDAEAGCMTRDAHSPPEWDGMPAPRPVMVLSWEDVWSKLYDALGCQPTKEEVKAAFEEAARRLDDGLIDDFWICIEQLAEEYSERTASNGPADAGG